MTPSLQDARWRVLGNVISHDRRIGSKQVWRGLSGTFTASINLGWASPGDGGLGQRSVRAREGSEKRARLKLALPERTRPFLLNARPSQAR